MSIPKVIKSEVIYHGRIIDLIIEETESQPSNIQKREIVKHNGSGVIVPLVDKNEILFVRQYRYPIKDFVLEIPAGKLEQNENPLECAKRELLEETGYTTEKFEKLTTMLPTPGYCNEVLHIFLATDLKKSSSGQNLDEDEQGLTIASIPLPKAIEMIERGEIVDGKTIVGVLLAERKLKTMNKK